MMKDKTKYQTPKPNTKDQNQTKSRDQKPQTTDQRSDA